MSFSNQQIGSVAVRGGLISLLLQLFCAEMHLLFTCLIIAQFVVVAAHDWINIPGIACGNQVQAVIGRKLAWATAVNCLFPGFAVALAIRFFQTPKILRRTC